MYSNRLIFYALFLVAISSRLEAAFHFKQDAIFCSFGSEEGMKDVVNEFFRLTKDDPSIKVIDIRYTHEIHKGVIGYVATITCHVSDRDDLLCIAQKALRNFDDSKKKFSLKKPFDTVTIAGASMPQELACVKEKASKN